MRYKKFLLIPALVFIYLFFIVDFLVSYNPAVLSQTTTTAPSPLPGQQIGVGESISVTVTRPYFFGLFRLPVYTNHIGYIGGYHQAFFYLIIILTVVFAATEWFVEIDFGGHKNTSREKFEWRGEKMKGRNWQLKDIGKAIGLGIAFGFVTYILSADGGVSVGLGLLLMYLEYKLK